MRVTRRIEDGTVFEVHKPSRGIEAVGPFEQYRIVVDGYQVPRLTGRLTDGVWHFTFDNRFGCEVPEKHGCEVAWMIANAQAVGAGFSCFGENSQPLNEFKCRLLGLGVAPDIEAIEAQGGEQ